MGDEYKAYLQSDRWREVREQRLHIGRWKCAACEETRDLEIHHLTYERIFKEEMADLIPLCKRCHKLAEGLIKEGILTRTGNVLELAATTVRKISSYPWKRIEKAEERNRNSKEKPTPQMIQEELLEIPRFMEKVRSCSRDQFKKLARKEFTKKEVRYKVNALIIYDRYKKTGRFLPKPSETNQNPF